jgi:hypothetical protein
LGKIQLPLHLRGDEQDIVGHQKKRVVGGLLEKKK